LRFKQLKIKWVWTPGRIVGAVVVLAFLLRVWSALQLPVDFDEPVYLEAAYDYAAALRAGDLGAIIDYSGNQEHPPLVKLLYGGIIYGLGEGAAWTDALFAARILSAVFGTLAVLLAALVHPLAGGMLAVQTLAVKYTSQAYLEALPHFASTAAVFAFWRFSIFQKSLQEFGLLPRSPWFWLSAAALGLTMAGKYTYFPVIFVILFLAFSLHRQGFSLVSLLPYFAAAGFVFLLLNPSLWNDPTWRLADSLLFHPLYAQSAHVEASGYAWYQPVIWIAHSAAFQWHPDVIFYLGFDGPIFWLAVLGVAHEWRSRRWLIVWLGTSMLILLLWPTKWPQYTLVLIPALCLAASGAAERLYNRVAEYESYYGTLREMLPRPPKAFWFMLTGILGFLFIGAVAHNLSIARGRVGWSQLITNNSFLPSNSIHSLLSLEDGQIVIGTDHGLVFWEPPAGSDLPQTWTVYTVENSGLPGNRILSLAGISAQDLWIGTLSGVAHLKDGEWNTYRAADLGLPGEQVNALALGSDSMVWAGTSSGAAAWDGHTWTPYTTASGLVNDAVFAVEVEPLPAGDRVWLGTLDGLSRLDTAAGEWTTYTRMDFDMPRAGIADLQLGPDGRVWMASLGGGLYAFDGNEWQVFRTNNSEIPYNLVQSLVHAAEGRIWLGIGIPNAAGGVIAELSEDGWATYTPRTSGYTGGEPVSLAIDADGRLWIGTRTDGIVIYQFGR
jgi:hypothetical protein